MRYTATAGKPASIEKTLAKRTYALFLLCSVAAVALLTWFTLVHFERILLPQVLAKSDVIASSVRTTIEEATGLGIPYDSLVGVAPVEAGNAKFRTVSSQDLKLLL